MNYISSKEASEKWKISKRRVIKLANEGRIEGATLLGNSWIIPADTPKPQDMRYKTEKPEDNKEAYCFPLFYYCLTPEEYERNNLTPDEKVILSAALHYEKLELKECISLLTKLLYETDNRYIRISSYYLLTYAYYGIEDFEKSVHSYHQLELEISQADDHIEELKFIAFEADTLFNGIGRFTDTQTLDFNPDYSKEFLVYLSLCQLLTDVSKMMTGHPGKNTVVSEILCKSLESQEYCLASATAHFYLYSIYMISDNDAMSTRHIRKTLETVEKYGLYGSISYILSYSANYESLIREFTSPETAQKLLQAVENNKNIHNNCLKFLGKSILYLDLTQENYKYISYAIKGYTIDEMAEKENTTLYKVKKNIKDLCNKFNVTNRKELIAGIYSKILNM